MFLFIKRSKEQFLFASLSRLIVCVLSLSLIFSPAAAQAQSVNLLNLPLPGTMVQPSPAFVPVLLKGMTIHPDDPLKFDFIIDSGNSQFTADEVKKESERLVKSSLAAMTVPKDDLWVNLSPYEADRIIPDELGKTELGRDMLAQDYILKQLTASLMYPEEELGKKFWDKVYQEAQERFGTSEIPVNTFNKVWIVPETAVVYEHEQTVYVVDAYLRVMLDADYQSSLVDRDSSLEQENGIRATSNEQPATNIIREIIIPAIEREVNQGAHFAPLRQIYHSLILAKWYKETVKNSLLSQVYVDQNKTAGVETDDPALKDKIYAQYMEAYKKGVFNYIKEDYVAMESQQDDTATPRAPARGQAMDFQQKSTATPYAPAEGDRLPKKTIPRKYFSGGEQLTNITLKKSSSPIVGDGFEGKGHKASVVLVTPQKDGVYTEQGSERSKEPRRSASSPVANNRLIPEYKSVIEFMDNYLDWRRAHPDHKLLMLIRHGESGSNLFEYRQTYDRFSPPTMRGVKQSKALAEFFAQREISFDSFVSSDLERAYVAVRYLAQLYGQEPEIKKRFREAFIPMEELLPEFVRDPVLFRIPGYSGRKVKKYLRQFIDEITESKNKNIVVATHGITKIITVMELLGIQYNQYWTVYKTIGNSPNLGITFLAYDSHASQWRLLVYGDDSYLPQAIRGKTTSEADKKAEHEYFLKLAHERMAELESGEQNMLISDYYPDHEIFELVKESSDASSPVDSREASSVKREAEEDKSSSPVGDDVQRGFEIASGIAYWKGTLTTTPLTRPFRASRKTDVFDIADIDSQKALQLERLAVESLLKGKGAISVLVAGASSRMNVLEAPEEVKRMVEEGFLSKALVPVGEVDGQVITYLDAFGMNVSRLFKSIAEQAKLADRSYDDIYKNLVPLLSNEAYLPEHLKTLAKNNNYDLKAEEIQISLQPLGAKYVGTESDVNKLKNKFSSEEQYQKAVALSQDVKRRLETGDQSAVILEGEREPLGHGEYFHQMIVSGQLLKFIESSTEWIYVRNIDNYAAKFDKSWLRALGWFLEQGLDFAPEVSPRAPGQKGGGLIVMEDTGGHQLVEDPALLATKNSAGEPVVAPTANFWINDAAGFMSIKYIINIYKTEGQTDSEFIEELKAADHQQRLVIAERGRQKFPKILDAKPAKNIAGVAVKPETNMWQSTGVVSPEMKIKALGVGNARTFPVNDYDSMSKEEKRQSLANLRFLATKQWDRTPSEIDEIKAENEKNLGRKINEKELALILESYRGNRLVADDLLEYILKEDLVTPGILQGSASSPVDSREASSVKREAEEDKSSSPVSIINARGMLKGIPKAVESLQGRDLRGKNILIRANLNVPIQNGEIKDEERIKLLYPLLDFLTEKQVNVIFIGHHGRYDPDPRKDNRRSLKPVAEILTDRFPSTYVRFHADSIDRSGLRINREDLRSAPDKFTKGSIHILENVRFAHAYELGKNGDERREQFGRELAQLSDGLFILEAFGDAGSNGASVEDIPRHVRDMGGEVFTGPAMEREFDLLEDIISSFDVLILGGSKLDKVDLMERLILNSLSANGFALIGSGPSVALNGERRDLLEKLRGGVQDRVLTALDYRNPDNTLDIGNQTVQLFLDKLDTLTEGQTVLLNGTMGMVEDPNYEEGTRIIFEKLKSLARDRGTRIIVIGGDASSNAKKYRLDEEKNVIFISGGGVPLKILAGEKLVGIDALKAASGASSPQDGASSPITTIEAEEQFDEFYEKYGEEFDRRLSRFSKRERRETSIDLLMELNRHYDSINAILAGTKFQKSYITTNWVVNLGKLNEADAGNFITVVFGKLQGALISQRDEMARSFNQSKSLDGKKLMDFIDLEMKIRDIDIGHDMYRVRNILFDGDKQFLESEINVKMILDILNSRALYRNIEENVRAVVSYVLGKGNPGANFVKKWKVREALETGIIQKGDMLTIVPHASYKPVVVIMFDYSEEIGIIDYAFYGEEGETVKIDHDVDYIIVDHEGSASSPLGGIDMNAINVDRQGGGVDIQFDPVEIQEIIDMGITGFAPVIINITPLLSVLPLLGLAPNKEEELEMSSLN